MEGDVGGLVGDTHMVLSRIGKEGKDVMKRYVIETRGQIDQNGV